ncbi:MAG: hypothetical protein IT441_09785 [Phycisphaeraceae bacterium]|nr:hypothetical protein [Phycisphaeraceae bacterium]
MPLIHVRSLPLDPSIAMPSAVKGLTKDFSKATGIGIEHITATWEFFPPGHYAVAGRTARRQPRTSHPVLVDLLTPDFNDAAEIRKMLKAVASSIAKRAKMPKGNIFINHRQAHSGRVFDAGKIVEW